MEDGWENLINRSFKTLINRGTNYASFNENDIMGYVREFKRIGVKEILDPMSGYGTLTRVVNNDNHYSAALGKKMLSTYCVEINAPCYLWQFLCLPQNKHTFLKIIKKINECVCKFPSIDKLSEMSSLYFTEYGSNTLKEMYMIILDLTKKIIDIHSSHLFALSILIPYSSRLSTSSNGDIRHVKKGGLVIYKNYIDDFKLYLYKIGKYLESIPNTNIADFNLILGDAKFFGSKEFKINKNKKFECMITSPPYPNRVDYEKMFAVENEILDIFHKEGFGLEKPKDFPIGTPKVSGKEKAGPIWSNKVNDFIDKIESYNKNDKAASAARSYYAPYFRNYFYELQTAYCNISKYCAPNFEGIITVRDNFSKGYIVPVHDFIEDTWTNLGYTVEITKSKEVPFVGLKNKHVKGKKMSTHDEYDILIKRGKYD